MVSIRRRFLPQVCYGSPVARRPTVFTFKWDSDLLPSGW